MAYQGDPLATASLASTSFVNGILIRHPFLVLRRQCQCHPFARTNHLTPVSIVPIVFKIANKDGILSLWKGAIGTGVLWAFSQVAEVLIADIFSLPRNFVFDGSREKFWRHILLKAATYFSTTPFIVSSFIECVRDSIYCILPYQRRFIIQLISLYQELRTILFIQWPKDMCDRTRFHSIMPEIFSNMTSLVIADLALYPFETVLHRLFIQGTRTLVDDMDTGIGAISIGTRYSGIIECVQTIIDKEGFSSFYNGVGSIALQYILQFGVMFLVRIFFDYIDNVDTGNKFNHHHSKNYTAGIEVSSNSFNDINVTSPQIIPQEPSSSLNLPTFAQTQSKPSGFGPFGQPKNFGE